MASRNKYLYLDMLYGGQKFRKYFSSLRIRGAFLLTGSYIGELRNDRKF